MKLHVLSPCIVAVTEEYSGLPRPELSIQAEINPARSRRTMRSKSPTNAAVRPASLHPPAYAQQLTLSRSGVRIKDEIGWDCLVVLIFVRKKT